MIIYHGKSFIRGNYITYHKNNGRRFYIHSYNGIEKAYKNLYQYLHISIVYNDWKNSLIHKKGE